MEFNKLMDMIKSSIIADKRETIYEDYEPRKGFKIYNVPFSKIKEEYTVDGEDLIIKAKVMKRIDELVEEMIKAGLKECSYYE